MTGLEEVIWAFMRGDVESKGNISCSETRLYSFGTPIAIRKDGMIILNIESYSQTTARHQAAIRRELLQTAPAMIRGSVIDEMSMLYLPSKHKSNYLDPVNIESYCKVASILRKRNHTAYAKKLEAMTEEDIRKHNEAVTHRNGMRLHNAKIEYFSKGTTLQKRHFPKMGERGTIGKIIDGKFEIQGMKGKGDLFKLLAAEAKGLEEGDDLSTEGSNREWIDHFVRVSKVSKMGVSFNGVFMTHKQLKQMIRRGNVKS